MIDYEQVVSFMIENSDNYLKYGDEEDLLNEAKLYNKFFNLGVVNDDDGIVAVWFTVVMGNILYVKELVIRKSCRSFNIIKKFILAGKVNDPQITHIAFKRVGKYPDRQIRVYNINKFFHRRK